MFKIFLKILQMKFSENFLNFSKICPRNPEFRGIYIVFLQPSSTIVIPENIIAKTENLSPGMIWLASYG